MASVTLPESAKLSQDELVAGIIENIISVNPMFDLIPFDGIEGNALAYNRENALGNVVVTEVGDLIASQGANPIDSRPSSAMPRSTASSRRPGATSTTRRPYRSPRRRSIAAGSGNTCS
jgi:hypothetical protein